MDILSEIEKISGLELIITGVEIISINQKSSSKHNTETSRFCTRWYESKNDKKIGGAVLQIILSGRYGMEIGLINERVYLGRLKGLIFI